MSLQDVSRGVSPTLRSSGSASLNLKPPVAENEKVGDDVTEEIEYPEGLKLGLITLALCLSVFLVALDNTIIATAIPKITDQFKSLDDVGWFVASLDFFSRVLTTVSQVRERVSHDR
jgi:hypothetical protein